MRAVGPLRVGAVSYLNTKPLIYGLQAASPDIELVLDLPSRLSDRLAAGQLDVALIPSIECFRAGPYEILSDACIACRGPVLSVKLFSRVPSREITTLALDEGSRTSGALVQILLHRRYGIRPVLSALPIGGEPGAMETDAVLLIGDRAIHAPVGPGAVEWDLGEEWCELTRLPFVFAMWTARRGAETSRIEEALCTARDTGLERLEEIAGLEGPRVGLTLEACLGYLRNNLHFKLGAQERLGLQRFHQEAVELGLADAATTPERIGLLV